MSTNQWVGIGNLGADPVLRNSRSGTPVCNFSIAIDSPPSRTTGDKRVDWIPITAWGDRAEVCAKYLQKGSQVCVTGQLRQRVYEDTSGAKHNGFEVRASDIQFLKNIRSTVEASQHVVEDPSL